MMVQRNAVADFEFRDTLARADNGPRSFVAKDSRRRNGAKMDFLDIRWANAAHRDFHQQFVGPDPRHRNGLHAQVVSTPINDRAH